MEVTINVTVGNDVEGINLDSQLVEEMWGSPPTSHLASNVRDWVKLNVLYSYMVKEAVPWAVGQSHVEQHTDSVH